MGPFMFLDMVGCSKCFSTIPTTIWFFTSMDSFMIFAMAFLSKLFVTMITRKWLFTSMGPFMVLGMAGFFECFFAVIARIRSSSYKNPSMSLIGKTFRCDTYKKIILMKVSKSQIKEYLSK